MPKDKLVVGSPAAAAVAQELGFTNVFGLDHGKTMSVCNDKLQITGTAGQLINHHCFTHICTYTHSFPKNSQRLAALGGQNERSHPADRV